MKEQGKPRKIVFVNQATGYLTIDIVNAFAAVFDHTAVMSADIRIQDVELDPTVRFTRLIRKSRKSNASRFFRWLIATLQVTYHLGTRYRKHEIFYFSVPPFGYFASLLYRRRFSLLMWDVYPDALRIVGIGESHWLFRSWERINKRLFKRAHRLYTIGKAPAERMGRYAPEGKVRVIPLWAGLKDAGPVPVSENPFIRTHGLEGKFIVQFSGNLGSTHQADSLIRLAEQTRSQQDVLYLYILRGTRMGPFRERVRQYGLENVKILPFQPDHLIRYSLAAAHVSLIPVEEKAAELLLPSKIYNLLAVGSPILGISPPNSELNNMIESFGLGRNFQENDVKGMAQFITQLKERPDVADLFKRNVLKASAHFTSDNAGKYLESYLEEP